ncbi:CapA family protein [Candidatus Peregrinibacteria bacterium]|nr:CapA family protein [Candidatus Peregrinibacteria bacterium]
MPKKKLKKKKLSKKSASKKVRAAIKKSESVLAMHKAPLHRRLQKIKEHLHALKQEHVKPKIFTHMRSIFIWSGVFVAAVLIMAGLFIYSKNKQEAQEQISDSQLVQTNGFNLFGIGDADEEVITLIATGDVLLARYVEQRMRATGDYLLPFKLSADFLKSADVTFGNLETPLLNGANTPKDSTTFRADPASVKGLQFAGYDVVSVANNHTMNYQIPGLTNTLKELKKAGILTSGGGKNQDAAHTPAILEVKGKTIAFLSYVDTKIPPRNYGIATYNTPGLASMDIEAMKNDVKNAQTEYDIVVVSMHSGTEYKKEPAQFQKDFAHAAIDSGANVVIGHHPHVVQPVEYYGTGVIFYSLGNFVFDQFFSQDVQTGLVARITFEEGEKPAVELFPVKIETTQPRILEGVEREEMLKKLGNL